MQVSNGRGELVDIEKLPIMVAGTMVTTDIVAARKFYEEFLGLDCVSVSPTRLLLRDQQSKREMEQGGSCFFLIEVMEVEKITREQVPLNHWGITVGSEEDVDRIRAAAVERTDEFGLQKIMPITRLHGAYGFFVADRDKNWWEIEYKTHGRTNNMVYAEGDGVPDA